MEDEGGGPVTVPPHRPAPAARRGGQLRVGRPSTAVLDALALAGLGSLVAVPFR